MTECLHGEFKATVDVTRLTDHPENPADGFRADVRIICTECAVDFEFLGLPGGSHPALPTVGLMGKEARLPIRPWRIA